MELRLQFGFSLKVGFLFQDDILYILLGGREGGQEEEVEVEGSPVVRWGSQFLSRPWLHTAQNKKQTEATVQSIHSPEWILIAMLVVRADVELKSISQLVISASIYIGG